MPNYEYETCGMDCDICGGRFMLQEPASRPPTKTCPACQRPVRRVVSSFNVKKGDSVKEAKRAGFTVLKRLGKGEYEKQ